MSLLTIGARMAKVDRYKTAGFTVVELVVVIVVIGILSTVIIVGYQGMQARARDTSVLSDIDNMDSLQTNYGLKNKLSGKAYYSGNLNGYDGDLGFRTSEGNVIDVVIDVDDYCIRGYNPGGTKNSIYNAYTKESSSGVCDKIKASDPAVAASPQTSGYKLISTGEDHTCAVAYNENLYCWGTQYSDGALGNGSNSDSSTPVAVTTSGFLANKKIKSISAGYNHTCAIASDDNAYCWGQGTNKALGDGFNVDRNAPVAVVNTSGPLLNKKIKSISAGYNHTCAIASDDKAYCWGTNTYGQLGNSSNTDSNVPVAVSTPGILNGALISTISAGMNHTCFVANHRMAYCMGDGFYGQVTGDDITNDSNVPVSVVMNGALASKTVRNISASYNRTCLTASDNKMYCVGHNIWGQLGDNSRVSKTSYVAVNTSGSFGAKTITTMTTGYYTTCSVASDGDLFCWGDNYHGQVGDGTSGNDKLLPVIIGASGLLTGKKIRYTSSTGYRTCAIASDDNAYCWGDDRLGNGSTSNSTSPVLVNTVP